MKGKTPNLRERGIRISRAIIAHMEAHHGQVKETVTIRDTLLIETNDPTTKLFVAQVFSKNELAFTPEQMEAAKIKPVKSEIVQSTYTGSITCISSGESRSRSPVPSFSSIVIFSSVVHGKDHLSGLPPQSKRHENMLDIWWRAMIGEGGKFGEFLE